MIPPRRIAVHYNKSIRAAVPALEEANHYESARRLTGGLSVLYVALTRARHALYMAVPAYRPDSSVITAGRVLQEAVDTGDSATDFESGTAHWFEERVPVEISASAALAPERIVLRKETGKQRSLQRQAASRHLWQGQIDVGKMLAQHTSAARLRGSEIHKSLEVLTLYQAEDFPAAAAEAGTQLQGEYRSQLLQQLQAPEIRALFEYGSYYPHNCDRWEVVVEQRFAFVASDGIANGAIDRIVIGYRNAEPAYAEVIDFKSDRLPSGRAEDLSMRARYYTPQLHMYREAAARLYQLSPEQIRCRIAFLAMNKVVDV